MNQKHQKLLEKYNTLNQKSLILMGLKKPVVSLQLLFNRFNYRRTHNPKIISTEMFFGQQMNLVLPDKVAEFLYYFKFFEYKLTKIVLEHVKKDMIFVDVGAHFGYYSLLASEIVESEGEVHSFEPTPSTFKILKSNLEKDFQFVNNLACWSENKFLEFNDFGLEFAAWNSFTNPRVNKVKKKWDQNPKINKLKKQDQKIKVKATTLDTYFKNKSPDFVKIDAESTELEVLKGMEKIINDSHPMITLEVGDLHNVPKSKFAIDYLLDRNYDCFEYVDGKTRKHKILDTYYYDNLLFTKNNISH